MNPNPRFLEKLCEALGERVDLAAKLVDLISTTPAACFAELANSGFDMRDEPVARKALDVLVRHGVLTGSSDQWQANPCACNASLAAALQGAAVSRRLVQRREGAVVAATLPTGAGALASMLPELGRSHALVETTGAAFEEIARAAQEDFTVFAPFLNDKGAGWLRDLFASTSATERCLVVRDWTRSRPILNPVLDELADLGVQIFDYYRLQPGGYETFHAKLLIADDSLAYVGSANFLQYRRSSMELGVLIRGSAARTVRFVGEGMKGLAHHVSYGGISIPTAVLIAAPEMAVA